MKDYVIDLLLAVTPLVAVLVASFTLFLQYRFFHKERKPVVTPLPLEFSDFELPGINKDWETDDDIGRKFSASALPITNYGGTTAIVKSYNYHFNNFEDIRKELERHNSHSEYVSINKDNNNSEAFHLKLCTGGRGRNLPKIESVLQRGFILRVDEEQEIVLPSYFIIISNWYVNTKSNNFFKGGVSIGDRAGIAQAAV